ncbi:serine/threonine-protein phosphatase 2A activator-like [Dermatophagoides pteronyssinus]|uniref:Serine/threonine-protein phosphatase 2A activator n=1 Tax=Dermatophagoides pteronyssinus TaxID=6956 RepID=A0A6P6Y1W6_DERPT|nr:serine/threonine-protein phosphatase 2A activator-like [Dermatophagoides pteronyssinus]
MIMMNSEGDFNQNNDDDDDDGVDNPILNEPKSNDDEDDDNIETKCYRRILNATDMEMWIHSEAYRDYLNFIKLLNEFAKGVHNRKFQSRDEVNDEYLCNVIRLLDNLGELCDQIEPINDDKNQRFGNKAYRIWFDEMLSNIRNELVNIFGHEYGSELSYYLADSFGNKVRIDYGTGHEMCFIIFLMGIYKLVLIPNALEKSDGETLSRQIFQSFSHQLLNIFALTYMPLVRKIQLRYCLEPAGSHGVFSLDDFQFLPFYFGSAQLIDHPTIDPGSFPQANIANQYQNEYIFHSAVNFIHQVKKGPFAEHSNQLWNISGVQDWSKINSGLFKMYCKEYLPKFQIVQHLVFGPKILIWKRLSK